MKKVITQVLLLMVIMMLAIWIYQYGYSPTEFLYQLKSYAAYLREYVAQQYLHAVWWYSIAMCVSTFFFLPTTAALSVLGGYLFGWIQGAVYAIGSVTIGSACVFVVVRYLGGAYVQHRYAESLYTFNRELDRAGVWYLMIIQLLPFTPTWLINTLAGLTSLSLGSFMFGTALGIAPGTFLYTYAGQEFLQLTSVHDIMSWHVAVLFICVALLLSLPLFITARRLS